MEMTIESDRAQACAAGDHTSSSEDQAEACEALACTGDTRMPSTHWLQRTHEAMRRAGMDYLWRPGSTAWRQFLPEFDSVQAERRAIRRAQREGYFTTGEGIPQLTPRGYQRY